VRLPDQRWLFRGGRTVAGRYGCVGRSQLADRVARELSAGESAGKPMTDTAYCSATQHDCVLGSFSTILVDGKVINYKDGRQHVE
jgi:hypothetical protein